MLKELEGDKDAQIALMLILAEQYSFDKNKTVKDFMVRTEMKNATRAYAIYRQACDLASFQREIEIRTIHVADQLQKALNKAVNEYEKTGRNVKDIEILANVYKEVLGVTKTSEPAKGASQVPAIQNNNITLDTAALKAVLEEVSKREAGKTVNITPDG